MTFDLIYYFKHNSIMDLETDRKEKNSVPSLECYCDNEKKIRTVQDGGFGDKFIVEYCQKCYDSDDRQYEISMEMLF